VLPDSVTSLGWLVFCECDNLKTISIPAGLDVSSGAMPKTTQIIRR